MAASPPARSPALLRAGGARAGKNKSTREFTGKCHISRRDADRRRGKVTPFLYAIAAGAVMAAASVVEKLGLSAVPLG